MREMEKLDRVLKAIVDQAEVLFGDVAELPENELVEMLKLAGMDPDALSEQLHRAVKESATKKRRTGEAVAQRLLDAIEQTRPISEPSRSLEYAEKRAGKCIKQLLAERVRGGERQVAFAFRNRKDLTENDRRILDRFEEILRRRARGENVE